LPRTEPCRPQSAQRRTVAEKLAWLAGQKRSTPRVVRQADLPQARRSRCPEKVRGDGRNRTGVDGFAGRCVATPPRRLVRRRSVAVACSAGLAVARLASPGRLAQLGERRLDKAEVTGSSPVSPIPAVLALGRTLQTRGKSSVCTGFALARRRTRCARDAASAHRVHTPVHTSRSRARGARDGASPRRKHRLSLGRTFAFGRGCRVYGGSVWRV